MCIYTHTHVNTFVLSCSQQHWAKFKDSDKYKDICFIILQLLLPAVSENGTHYNCFWKGIDQIILCDIHCKVGEM